MTNTAINIRKAQVFTRNLTSAFVIFLAKIINKLQTNIRPMASSEMFIFVIGSIYIWLAASFAFFASLYHTSQLSSDLVNLYLDVRIDYSDESAHGRDEC
jgi:hypothetical protein